MDNFSEGLLCLSTSGNHTPGTLEIHKELKYIFSVEIHIFSTDPGKNFDLCIISTRTKTQ